MAIKLASEIFGAYYRVEKPMHIFCPILLLCEDVSLYSLYCDISPGPDAPLNTAGIMIVGRELIAGI